jgi:hypothetical protein
MIVLAPLLIFTVVLVAMVVAGRLLHPPPPNYVMPTRPFKAVVVSGGVIRLAGRPIRQLEVDDTVWVVRAGNGLPVLFADSTGTQVLGVAEVLLSPIGP